MLHGYCGMVAAFCWQKELEKQVTLSHGKGNDKRQQEYLEAALKHFEKCLELGCREDMVWLKMKSFTTHLAKAL